MESEEIVIADTRSFAAEKDVIPNLKWLIPLCFDEHIEPFDVYDIGGN